MPSTAETIVPPSMAIIDKYRGKEHGPRKVGGQYVHTGDSVGVVMDTAKGELSFALKGVNLGVAYEGIPLDKPLVPLRCPCIQR